MRFTKWLMILLLLVSSLSAGFYVWHSKTNKVTPPVSLQVLESSRSLYFLPQYIALEKRFFKEQHLKVELKTAASPQEINAAIKEQNLSFIICASEIPINYPVQDSGNPVAIAALTAREGTFLLGRKGQSGFDWEDVKRKSIIVDGPDSLQNMLLESILREKNIGPNYEVNIIQNLPGNLIRGVFKSGTASFVALTEPEATLLENAGEGKIVASLGVEGGEIPAAAIVSNQEFLKTHPQTAQKYINAVYKARLWMKHHSTPETVALIKDFFPETEPQVLLDAIDRYKAQGTWCPTPVISRAGYENLLKIMGNSGELVKPKKYEEAVDNQYTLKAVKTITYVPEEKKKKKFPFSLWDK